MPEGGEVLDRVPSYGRLETLRENFRRLLESRFGPASRKVSGRLSGADQSRLDIWFTRAPSASNLDSAFDLPPGESG